MDKKNKAQISRGECFPEEHKNIPDKFEMIVVTNYIPVDVLRKSHSIYESKLKRKATREEEDARIAEITGAYQGNLRHPHITALYILVEHYESLIFLNSLNFTNSEKLVIVWVGQFITMKDSLLYISKCFKGRFAALIGQDIRIGKGFEKIRQKESKVLREKKILYAVTRHGPYRQLCYRYNCGLCV